MEALLDVIEADIVISPLVDADHDIDGDHTGDGNDNDGETSYVETALDPALSASPGTDTIHERWERTFHARGRQAKDPLAQHIRFDCQDIDDFENNLATYLSAPTAPAEHAVVELHFPVTSAFMVYTRDYKRDPSVKWTKPDVQDVVRKMAVSVFDVLQDVPVYKQQIIRQKAVARIIIEAVERADGFRYTFHNNWLSKDDKAHRFTFMCNDSTLNKGRVVNGSIGTEGKRRRKPAYPCQGLIAIKFSVTKNNLEVHYKHVPLHKTYNERAPLPRHDSKRRRMADVLEPGTLPSIPPSRKKVREKPSPSLPKLRKDKVPRRKPKESDKHKVNDATPLATSNDQQRNESLQPLAQLLRRAETLTFAQDRNPRGQIEISSNENEIGGSADVEEVRSPPPRLRKIPAPTWPGQINGSMTAGSLEFDQNTQSTAVTKVPTGTSSNSVRASDQDIQSVPLSELEILRKQLAETQERLAKLEAERCRPSEPPAWPTNPGLFFPPASASYPQQLLPSVNYTPRPQATAPIRPASIITAKKPPLYARQPELSFFHYTPPVKPKEFSRDSCADPSSQSQRHTVVRGAPKDQHKSMSFDTSINAEQSGGAEMLDNPDTPQTQAHARPMATSNVSQRSSESARLVSETTTASSEPPRMGDTTQTHIESIRFDSFAQVPAETPPPFRPTAGLLTAHPTSMNR